MNGKVTGARPTALLLFCGLALTFATALETFAADRGSRDADQRASAQAAQAPPDPAPVEMFRHEPDLPLLAAPETVPMRSDFSIEPDALTVTGGTWVSQGPGPIQNGQVEGVTNGLVIGAVQTIVAHPTNADIVWIGAVNGGIWKTTNATAASPTWTAAGDAFSSLSIGALDRDPTDAIHNTLVAGFGRFSSFGGVGGPRSGLLRTTNGGTTWTALASGNLSGKNISGLAARGANIVVSVNIADSFTCGNIGIFRSTDTGANFTKISGGAGTGIPSGRAFDLAGDPINNAVLYTAIRDAVTCGGGTNGVYKSIDTGATWAKVSSAAMDTLLANANVNNTRIAVGQSGQVFVGIIVGGQLAGLFRSGNGGTSWTQLDTPTTTEGGTVYGMQPRQKPGAQGNIHFSIVADPTNTNIVYLGGDRQPGNGDDGASFPNSIGATNYTGRLFRVDASRSAGTQATPLTHCVSATAACNSTASTVSNSSPHADSRRMVFDAAGNIIEGDDGGIYRRTVPRGTGDWFSMNGNLRITEAHDVAWDTVSNMLVTGNQDVGTSEQTAVGGTTWSQVSQGDGGDIAIDDSSTTQSIRYTSFQNLGALWRRTMNTAGAMTAMTFPALTVTAGDAVTAQFVTPVAINAIDPTRVLFAARNDLYESFNRGDSIAGLGFARSAPAIVYGGRSGGVDNAALIYAICLNNTTYPCTNENAVFVRTGGSGAPTQTATSPGSAALHGLAVDPADWRNVYVINSAGQVYRSTNTGANWTEVTGNLANGTTDLRSIVFVPGTPSAVMVGGANGVFRMAVDAAGTWNQFGSGLSNAPVWDLDYDPLDDVLVAGTMGRGAWKITPAANLGPVPTLSINDITVTEGNSGTTSATFTVSLSAAGGLVTVNYATADGTATSGASTAANQASIAIPSSGTATPYPSPISVSGLSGTITKVTARLTGLSHTYCSDIDVLLVGPGGQSVILMSDTGGSSNANNFEMVFDDDAASSLTTSAFTSGTYRPTNLNDGSDSFPAPADTSGLGTTLSVFNSTSPNGTWSLFVVDDTGGDIGSIAGGWSLTFTLTGGDYVPTSGTLTIAAGATSGTITVLVNGDTTNEPDETFFVNLSGAANATILDGQGQATITNDDGPVAAPTNVVATATGSTSVSVTWTAASGATSYRVYRGVRSAGVISYTLVGSPAGTTYPDTTVVANKSYLYKVRSFAAAESGDSNVDLATTIIFTDPTLTVGSTAVKLAHFNQLLAAVNAVRELAGQSAIAFSAPAPANGVTVRRQHVADLRGGIDAARTALALAAVSYGDPTLTAGLTPIKAAHLTEIRNGVK